MLTQLEKCIQLPEVFAASQNNFWDDPHISGELLKAHLDPHGEGASRKEEFIKKSVVWISQICGSYSCKRLLDLGCGPGLYSLPLAESGFHVTGIDFSQRSIAYAQKTAQNKALNLTYSYKDYLSLDYKNQFDIALIIYCDYGALSDENRNLLLQKVYQSLQPGGLFLLDVFTLNKLDAFKEEKTWDYYPQGGFWSSAEHMILQENKKYLTDISLENTVVIEDNHTSTYPIWHKYFTVDSLKRETEQAGFLVVDVFSDVSGTPFSPDSSTMALLLQK